MTFSGTEMNVMCDVQPVETFRLNVKDSIWLEYEKTGSRQVEPVTYPECLNRGENIVFLL